MNGGSLRLRLIAVGAVSVVAALALAVAGLTQLFASHVQRRAVEDLTVQLDHILASLDRDATGSLVVAAVPGDPRFTRPLGGLYWQVDTGNGQLRSRSLWDYALDLPADEAGVGALHVHTLTGPTGAPVLVAEREVTLPARLGGASARVAVAMERRQIDQAVTEFRADLLPYSALLAVFLILATAAQVYYGLKPLNAVERQVARVRSGDLTRVGADFPAEVRPLAAEVDALLEQRENDITQARQRAGDLAHGLKTPLQALLGEAQRLRDGGMTQPAEAIEQTADAMRRHVERELSRARIATRAATARSDLADVMGRVLTVVRRASGPSGPEWDFRVPPGMIVAAQAEDLSEIAGALLENAARFARRRVIVDAAQQASSVILTIRDDGPGISTDQIHRLTQRGMRADETGPGSGLGLAIATEIAEALGGGLDLVPADPGLEVRVTLPRTTV